MSEMRATWRPPTSSAPRGALARPPPRPRPRDHPGSKHFRLSGLQPLQAPRPAAAGTAPLGNLQAVRAGRRAGCGALSTELPCRPARLPRTIASVSGALEIPVSAPALLPTPRPL